MVCATNRRLDPRVYWINLASLDRTACAIFVLSALNPTIGGPGETCVNFVTHLRGRDRPLFRATDEELLSRYRDDFRAVFGFELEPFWTHITRVPMYSPVFGRSYPQPAGPERVVGKRVFRGELSNLSVHRVHRHRPGVGPRDRRGDARVTSALHRRWRLRPELPPRGECRVGEPMVAARPSPTPLRPGSRALALVPALRPHQWVKNLLVFVPVVLDHKLFDARDHGQGDHRLRRVLLRRLERLHPQRHLRPRGRPAASHEALPAVRLRRAEPASAWCSCPCLLAVAVRDQLVLAPPSVRRTARALRRAHQRLLALPQARRGAGRAAARGAVHPPRAGRASPRRRCGSRPGCWRSPCSCS